MSIATRTALRSGCLSRRVGAAILAANGNIIATGRNDVPQFGGGLYTIDSLKDHRCWTKSARFYNDIYKEQLVSNLVFDIKKVIEITDDEAIKFAISWQRRKLVLL